jgi:hypothetical protein
MMKLLLNHIGSAFDRLFNFEQHAGGRMRLRRTPA